MIRVLRVNDRLALPEILALLAPEARALQWSVFDLGEVVPGDGWDRRVPYRESRVYESTCGWTVTFDEVVAFGEWACQIIDGVFLACTSSPRLPSRSDSDLEIITQSEMVVAAVDSSFWYLGACDEIITRASEALHDWSVVDPGAIRLSTRNRTPLGEPPALLPLKIDVDPRGP